MSIRLRLTTLLGAALLVLISAFGVGVYLVLAAHIYGGIDSSLQRSGAQLAHRLESNSHRPDASLTQVLELYPHNLAFAYNNSGTQIGASDSASGLPLHPPAADLNQALSGRPRLITVSEGGPYRVELIPLTRVNPVYVADDGSLPSVLMVVTSLSSATSFLATLQLIFLVGAGGVLITAVGAGWVVASKGLRPITDLTRAAESLGQEADLSRRLPEPGTHDEVDRLSAAFNGSLNRLESTYRSLEESLRQQRQFVADASHELRTPLTVILANAETVLDHPEMSAEDRQRSIAEVRAEAIRMTDLSASLLQLAKGDSGAPIKNDHLDWDALVAHAVHDAEVICAPRSIRLETDPVLGVGSGDEASLLGVLRILFDNVARHAPQSESVRVRASSDPSQIRLAVADSGPGIRPELLPRIFDRFFRAEASRHGHGSGLGLAIAKAVIERHGGSIAADNADGGGLSVELRLPRFQSLST
ncbi:MAG TPA: ATP-binding protein [Candidatus Acidoferrales bacterium]|nr:ATP-binding protein [Candidatus Acidoferrales bacterium]